MARHEGLGGLHSDVTSEKALVLGFARRFATYKRAGLVLSDPDRLVRLMDGGNRPLVIVFAGKAHPRDDPGKLLVQRIVQASRDDRFRGRLVFLENYDVEIARLLVQGSDVWMNTPRRPQEASGTSGMKATLNGALHLSELDGWWDEAYAPGLGWALGEGIDPELVGEAHDAAEARQLMDLLEYEIVPLFYDRDAAGRPLRWLDCVARSIETMGPQFSAHRMVREYVERFYTPAGAAVARS
jgi:starch phosphorylase